MARPHTREPPDTRRQQGEAGCRSPPPDDSLTRQAHAEYFATLADGVVTGLHGSGWLEWVKRLERELDNLWAALSYARDAPDPDIAVRLGSPGEYFVHAGRVSEGRRFLELALAIAPDHGPAELRVDLLSSLCVLASGELDLDAALAAGERAVALGSRIPGSRESAVACLSLSVVCRQSGDHERALGLAEEARGIYARAQDDQGLGVTSTVRAGLAVAAGDVATVATMAAEARSHFEAVGYDALAPLVALFEAWSAERRGDRGAAATAYRRAVVASRRSFQDHASFALSGLGSLAFSDGDLLQAEDLFRRALAAAEGDPTSWPAAHARVGLARVLVAAGESEPAERLYLKVLEWSEAERPRRAYESWYILLADSPGAAALLGLAELADGRGDAAAADELRARAASEPA